MSTPLAPLANSELVAVAWLQTVPGVDPGQVATTLPTDVSTWAARGFLQVTPGIGGSPNAEYALRGPVVQVEAYAVNPSSGKPPWGKAASLMELVVAGTYGPEHGMRRQLSLRPGYPQVQVKAAGLLTEPRRREGDEASYACFLADLALHWISL